MHTEHEKLNNSDKQAVRHRLLHHPVVEAITVRLATVPGLFLITLTCTAMHAVQVAYIGRTFFDVNVTVSRTDTMMWAVGIQVVCLLACLDSATGFCRDNDRWVRSIWCIEGFWAAAWPSIFMAGFGLGLILNIASIRWTAATADSVLGWEVQHKVGSYEGWTYQLIQ